MLSGTQEHGIQCKPINLLLTPVEQVSVVEWATKSCTEQVCEAEWATKSPLSSKSARRAGNKVPQRAGLRDRQTTMSPVEQVQEVGQAIKPLPSKSAA